MTILFTASKNGKGAVYDKIINEIKSLGHNVRTREILSNKISAENVKSKSKFKRELEIADLMVAEVSDTSLSLGLEIATALDKGKHVLILCANNKSFDDLSDFIRDNSSRYAHICPYNNKNLGVVLKENMDKIRRQLNYVLYVELPNKYGDIIEDIQSVTNKSKKQIIEEALVEYSTEESSPKKRK